ncbi:MAG: Asp-tRNA(Asn)/Glu-tRNA(Gln) amidotransferase subunit GatA [Chitinivibrionales bacterium]|nr:Asp-tRNA(Asn)/Glu-tRNA(Gln) amidotransferase subunit GatA [Chitinivibrionales bacterium]MBD3395963.1 Asp-tRNA(Asn)/Glu-tRNA(Gln) amidotransferase subunit GatA [Chitinivibrionales bacterium]
MAPDQSLHSLVKAIRAGTVSSVDACRTVFERIEKRDGDIRSFVSTAPGAALARAAEIDALPEKDKARMPLAGAPVAVKDNICTRHSATTCASRMLKDFVPPYDAAVVEALERAGAVVVGKTNLDEFAMGSSTEMSWMGGTRNPHDPAYVPGGSSGGSAAAVAAGMVAAALGSDTGGSIRQPCSHCGVAGLKPTYGRVSRYGLVAFASSLDQIGPIAADVRDLGLLLSVIAAPDNRDSTCAGKIFENKETLYNGDVRGMKVGVPREYFGEGLSGGVRAAIETVVDNLRDAGVEIVDVSLPNVHNAVATYYIICTAEASSNLARYDGVKYGHRSPVAGGLADMYRTTREEGFGAEVKRRIMLGTYVLSSGYYDAYYLKAARVRTLIGLDFDRAFERCDAVISPVAPTAAFKIGEKCDDPLQMYLTDIYTVSANLAGVPGISVPCGKDGNLPVGAQFMAPKWREDTLLRLAFAAQKLGRYEGICG